jgi:RimJ/RimL family protein N-acetyltransferase
MRRLLKWLARKALGEYAIYHIVTQSEKSSSVPQTALPDGCSWDAVQPGQIERSEDASIRDRAFYLGEDAYAWRCTDRSGRVVGLCVYWCGERYGHRNFWPLEAHEAKLVEVITLGEMRGRGVASALIERSSTAMFERGFHRLYARIWHSNGASLKAFSRAGWVRTATVVELFLLGRWKWRMRLRPRAE